jgi:hypothetical protein
MQFWAPQTAAQPRMPFYLHVVNTRTKKEKKLYKVGFLLFLFVYNILIYRLRAKQPPQTAA